jgi:chaperone modulatory protein CbpM
MSETRSIYTLREITVCTRLSTETVKTIVEFGIVTPRGKSPEEWQFDAYMLATLRRACRVQRDLELDWAGTAVALDLIGELEQLREDNARLRRQLERLGEGSQR